MRRYSRLVRLTDAGRTNGAILSLSRRIATILALAVCGFVPAAGRQPTHASRCPDYPDAEGISALAVAPERTLLAGTQGCGLYRSADGGHRWTRLAAYPTAIWTGIVLVLPARPSTLLAGSSAAKSKEGPLGLERSEDGGATWTSHMAGLPTGFAPVQLAASARGTLVLSYRCLQTRCPRELARSDDGGRSWQDVGPDTPADVGFGIAGGVVPLADGSFLSAEAQSLSQGQTLSRFYRSADDGRTWMSVGTPPLSLDDLSTLSAVPWDARQVFAGFGLLFLSAHLDRSSDGGRRWSRVWVRKRSTHEDAAPEEFVIAFAALPRTHTLLFSTLRHIYRSTDDGASWTRSDRGLIATSDTTLTNATPAIWTLLSDPTGATVYEGTFASYGQSAVYQSTDDGRSWRAIATGV